MTHHVREQPLKSFSLGLKQKQTTLKCHIIKPIAYGPQVEPLRLKFENGPKTLQITVQDGPVSIISDCITSSLCLDIIPTGGPPGTVPGALFLEKSVGIFLMKKGQAVRVLDMAHMMKPMSHVRYASCDMLHMACCIRYAVYRTLDMICYNLQPIKHSLFSI